MGFFKKKEEKKKFDFSEDTKELFSERDAFYSEMRQKMGGEASNPEVEKVSTPEKSNKQEDLDDLLGGGDFNPYVNKEEGSMPEQSSVPAAAPPAPSSSSAFSCQSCGKEFQEKWGKCPSCGGEMKRAEAAPEAAPESVPTFTPTTPEASPSDSSSGDPLDDLLGDFGSGTTDDSSDDSNDTSSPNIRNSGDDLGTDFGSSQSSHSNRKIRKVKKVKRSRKQL